MASPRYVTSCLRRSALASSTEVFSSIDGSRLNMRWDAFLTIEAVYLPSIHGRSFLTVVSNFSGDGFMARAAFLVMSACVCYMEPVLLDCVSSRIDNHAELLLVVD